ncbi:unnamed protein product [Amoebophrya sp. A120]|nr:unnamed protein product [Amoebophrya sp. A120]|eukprot:GSA120T00010459001.1
MNNVGAMKLIEQAEMSISEGDGHDAAGRRLGRFSMGARGAHCPAGTAPPKRLRQPGARARLP